MNLILFDWLSFTSKIDTPESIIDMLGIDPFECPFNKCPGHNYYKYGIRFGNISIYFGGNDNTVMLNMSGQGCRDFETFSIHKDWIQLLGILLSDPDNYKITRLDVAFDDHDGVLDLWKIKKYSEDLNFVSKFSDIHVLFGCVNKDIDIQFGSQKSEVFFRCYDKAKERKREDGKHWIRFELQLRNSRAEAFARSYLENLDKGIGFVYSRVVNNYIRFVKPSKTDSNKTRWKTCKWWLDFVQTSEKISIFTHCDQEYNYSRMCNYIENQAGNAIDAYIKLNGLEGLNELIKNREVKPNPKYEHVVQTERQRRFFDSFEEVLPGV